MVNDGNCPPQSIVGEMRAKVKGVFVTPQRTAGKIWLLFSYNVPEYGGPTGPHFPQPLPPCCCHRRRCCAAAFSPAVLPSPPSCGRRNRRRALALPPPHFPLRRRRDAAAMPPPLPSFLLSLLLLSCYLSKVICASIVSVRASPNTVASWA
jgi:hypothetical protein